jgi:hypothetical protein
MAFKLTPKYSSKLQVGWMISLCRHSSWCETTSTTARLTSVDRLALLGQALSYHVPALSMVHALKLMPNI